MFNVQMVIPFPAFCNNLLLHLSYLGKNKKSLVRATGSIKKAIPDTQEHPFPDLNQGRPVNRTWTCIQWSISLSANHMHGSQMPGKTS